MSHQKRFGKQVCVNLSVHNMMYQIVISVESTASTAMDNGKESENAQTDSHRPVC